MTAAVADFSGWATRYNLECSDGRTILQDAFGDISDGSPVPLVYGHGHTEPEDVLGHAKLYHVPGEGVRFDAFFNRTPKGQLVKEQVEHGDFRYVSIFANKLKETAKRVKHGVIRELSVVLAGANPGAVIDAVNLAHSDEGFTGYDEDEAIITTGLELELAHADSSAGTLEDTSTDEPKSPQEILDTLTPEQESAVYYLLSQALTADNAVQHSADETDAGNQETSNTDDNKDEASKENEASAENTDDTKPEETAGEGDEAAAKTSENGEGDDDKEKGSEEGDAAAKSTDETSTEESEAGSTSNATDGTGDAAQHDNINQEDTSMSHNIFDQAAVGATGAATKQISLSHDDVKNIMKEVVSNNSKLSIELARFMKDKGVSVEGELKHGIENIEYLFPDAKTLENSPQWVSRRMEWVQKVLGSVRKAPFARIRSITADITGDEARARGYITGNMKNEEFFELSKRETTPQTVYKKQKLDRDDVIDIADLDVIAWLKMEMKLMLDEEIAGAILIGDGRSAGDEDKIREGNIRPIASDSELYTTQVYVNLDDANSSIEELVDAAITSREYYKGSGTPVFYTSEAIIAKFLTVKDGFGRRMYSNISEIAQVLRVSDVVPMDILGRVPDVVGIMVNLADYTIGTDRGGQATMFDDFDLDYNKLRYLLETRVSGALTTPKSALVFRRVAASAVLVQPDPVAFNKTSGVATVPSKTGVVYKNADTNANLTAGPQAALAPGATLKVKAVPDTGYYFADNQHDEWSLTRDA